MEKMKKIEIYVDGQYKFQDAQEYWVYYIFYKAKNGKEAIVSKRGYINGYGNDTRAVLEALKNSLGRLIEPCEIDVYTKKAIKNKFSHAKNTANKDIILDILIDIVNNRHIVKFNVDSKFAKPLSCKAYTKEEQREKEKHREKLAYKPDIDNKETIDDVFEHEGWNPYSGGY